jgi:predicted kinase
MSRIVIISGPPGAGKSTVTAQLARRVDAELAMHQRADDIYSYIKQGFVEPWRAESQRQNAVLMDALAAQAGVCAAAGYTVFVDGVVGPWYAEPWIRAAQDRGLELHFVLLLPDEATTVARATTRKGHPMTDGPVAALIWRRFHDYAPPDGFILDTTALDVGQTVSAIFDGLALGRFRLR